MTSSKQRREEIKAKRARKRDLKKSAKQQAAWEQQVEEWRNKTSGLGQAPVNPLLLAANNSYGWPDFVERGFYVDKPFVCADCGKKEIWTATQQKWWYEVAKGYVDSTAKRCRPCRIKERDRRNAARKTHLDGLAKKARK